MNPRECLVQAREAALDGRYQEALDAFMWFHDHALEHDRAYYGVRLSFALAYWVELAQVYPKAMDALIEVRNRKADVILKGEGDRELFHDVEAINESLAVETRTYELFRELHSSFPSLAMNYASLAMPAIVKAEDYQLAEQYLSNPEEKLKEWSQRLNEDIADLPVDRLPDAPPAQDAYEHIYADDVNLVISVLVGIGKSNEAMRFWDDAIAAIESPGVREGIRSKLVPRPQ